MPDKASKFFHMSLKVKNLSQSVEFYGRLLGVAPAKFFDDYAKFEIDDPAVVLSLEPLKEGDRLGLDHLGIRLPDRNSLIDVSSRIAERGLSFEHLDSVECCYSRQSKIYLNDPDGHLVEVYTVDADLADNRAARESFGKENSLCELSDGKYDHLLPARFPDSIKVANNTLNEINLRGTFNAAMDHAEAWRIVAECRRALKPGGRISTHILVSDRPVEGEIPQLPEPAAHVRRVPTEVEMQALFSEAGFVAVELKRFSHSSVFGFAGTEFREYLLTGSVPLKTSHNLENARQIVVYKGPFPKILDELGNSYVRGERVSVSAEAEALLRTPGYCDHFVMLVSGGGC